MKVIEILNESISKPSFDGKYPIARKAIESLPGNKHRSIAKFDSLIGTIKSAIEAGEILNTQFDDIKYWVNEFVDVAYNGAVTTPFVWAGKWEQQPEDIAHISVPSDARSINAFAKKLMKIKDKAGMMYKASKELTDELMNLYEVMEWLKAHVVKASVKKAEAKAAKTAEEATYQKKFTDHKDVKKVVTLLKGKASEVEKQIFENQLKWLMATAKDYQKKCTETGKSDYIVMYKNDPQSRMIIQGITTRTDRNYSHGAEKSFELVKGWKAKLDEDAKKTAATVVDGFVYKNSGKLSYILFNKNNMKSCDLKNVTVGRGAVEAEIHVIFADGSEFLADSSVVFAVSKLGTPFYRYPTIFRNVKLPDGSKLSGPSEQKMDEVFAITK
jgi:hypothetical protein